MTEKPALVLLHGWGSTASVWQPVVEQLQDGYECYLPELPGHGGSQFTQTRLRSLTEEILAAVDCPATWLGWSLGALIAMQAALLMPQQVQRLLIVGGTPAFVQHEGWNAAMPQDTFDQFQSAYMDNASKASRRFISLQALGDGQSKRVMQWLGDTSANRFNEIGWGLKVLRDGSLLSSLSSINCPVKCLYGENDALVPVSIQSEMQTRLNAAVTVWPDTGHVPFVSRPNAFVDWVKEATHG